MTTSAQVLAQLDQLGSRLEEFDQAVRQREARLAPGQVDEGFCRGVCTDWLRRVIQGGNPWYDPTIQRVGAPPKPAKTPQVAADRKEQQTLRMATIQLRGGSDALPATSSQQRLRSARRELAAIYDNRGSQTELTIPAGLLRRVLEFQVFEAKPKYSANFIDRVIDGHRLSVRDDLSGERVARCE